MLKAFYQQLRHMANNTEDRFHEHVQQRVGEGATPELEKDLKEAILMMPNITSSISVLWGHLPADSKIKALGSYFMRYMFSAKDFIPEDEAHGLFGYIDDAYFALVVYELLVEELIRVKAPLSKEDLSLKDKASRHSAQIKSVIAPEASEIQQIIGEVLDGEEKTFVELLGDK